MKKQNRSTRRTRTLATGKFLTESLSIPHNASVAQWLEHLTCNQEVGGSNPPWGLL